MKKVLILGMALVISGCAIQPAVGPDYNGPKATIQETAQRVDDGKAAAFYIHKIDGKLIRNTDIRSLGASRGQGNHLTIVDAPYEIRAEPQTLSLVGSYIWAMDIRGMVEADRKVTGELEFTPQAGHVYVVDGDLSKTRSTIQIKDKETGRVVGQFEQQNP